MSYHLPIQFHVPHVENCWFFYLNIKSWLDFYCHQELISSKIYARLFHTKAFFLVTFWPCNFSPQGIRKRLLVKCWWNWLQDVEMSTMHHEEIDVKCRLSDCCLCLSTSLSTLVQSYKQDRKKSQFLFNLISISLVFVWDFFKCTWLKVSTNTFCRNKNTCCST